MSVSVPVLRAPGGRGGLFSVPEGVGGSSGHLKRFRIGFWARLNSTESFGSVLKGAKVSVVHGTDRLI